MVATLNLSTNPLTEFVALANPDITWELLPADFVLEEDSWLRWWTGCWGVVATAHRLFTQLSAAKDLERIKKEWTEK